MQAFSNSSTAPTAQRPNVACQTEPNTEEMKMAEISKLNALGAVSAADRSEAIESINRVNRLFEVWDVDELIESFAPDAVVRHPLGVITGREAQRAFLEHYYPLVPGVSRSATGHIVDAEGDDLVVRYHNLLIRYAMPKDVETVSHATTFVSNNDGLP